MHNPSDGDLLHEGPQRPVQVGVFGRDLFRAGGDDSGAGSTVFDAIAAGFAGWWVVLLAIGVWSLRRV